MKVGLHAIGIGNGARREMIIAVATNAERLNFSTLWAPEHVLLVDNPSSPYPYGNAPIPGDLVILDPFVALTYAAALTTKLRLATGISLVPEHPPLNLGKTVASLDYVSGGRFVLGVGVGWLKEEFEKLGISWERRGERTCDYIEAMRTLWRDEVSNYSGEFARFEGVRCYPKPPRGTVPVWFGGESGPALRRTAKYGDGWVGWNLDADGAATRIKRIHELLKANGRKPSDVEIAVSPSMRPVKTDDLKRYRDAGVEEFVLAVRAPTSAAEMVKLLEQLARDFVEPAAKL